MSRFIAPVALTIGGGFLLGSSITNLAVLNSVEKNNLVKEDTTPTVQTVRNVYWLNVFILLIGLILLIIGIWTWIKATERGQKFIRSTRQTIGDKVYYTGLDIMPDELEIERKRN
jgi:hypothetical protein